MTSDQDPRREARLARRESLRRKAARERKIAAAAGIGVLAMITLAVVVLAQGPAAEPRAATSSNGGSFTIAAVGDTILGNTPKLPAEPTKYFSAVRRPLTSRAQIVFANLEGTMTDAIGGKCGSESTNCYSFKTPPSFARAFRKAGFTVLNNANNHSFDYLDQGQADTVAAIKQAGMKQTGLEGQVTIVPAGSARVAMLGFGPYKHMSSLLDLPTAAALIRRAKTQSDAVIVYMHAGGEGADAQHVTGADEEMAGEPRGNPQAFARMAVDAGASLVIGSGPHVLRGAEFYKGRLIAYSLGNFAGYHNFASSGASTTSCILRVTLTTTGQFKSARVVPVQLDAAGKPSRGGEAIAMMARLSREDFGSARAKFSKNGRISK